ncbi:MAG: translocation/assembly module TamB domain-containing protein [Gammaproteobacteria bacterium]|nr:translocation/assembly module TamB domain-containing protein [Gammaproteobacteria bacterium]
MLKLRRKLSILALFVILLIAFFYYLLATTSGLHLVVRTVNKFAPKIIVATNLQGALIGPISATQIDVHAGEQEYSFQNLQFDWSPKDLLLSKLTITKLSANNITIKIPPEEKVQQQKFNLQKFIQGLRLPVRLNISGVKLQNIVIAQTAKQRPIIINSVNLDVTTGKARIKAVNLNVLARNARLSLTGSTAQQYNFKLQANIANVGEFLSTAKGRINISGSLTGTTGKKNSKLIGHIAINNFRYKGLTIAQINTDMQVNIADKEVSHFTLRVRRVAVGNYLIRQLGLNGDVSVTSLRPSNPAARLDLRLLPTQILLISDSQQHAINLSGGEFTAMVQGKRLVSSLRLVPLHEAALNARFAVDKYKALRGKVEWHTKKLAFLPLLLPKLQKVNGQLDADFMLGGTIAKPQIIGTAQLKNASATIPSLNLNLKHIAIMVKGNLSGLTYSAQMQSNRGSLAINGKTELAKTGAPTLITINGENFRVIDNDKIQVDVSPSLKITFRDHNLHIDGTVYIPKAELRKLNFGGTETLPGDVVFVNKKQQDLFVKRSVLKVYSSIKLVLGDSVHINAMNANGDLHGVLQITDKPDSGTTATGQIYLKNGYYEISGKKLHISTGQLTFTGGPVDNPLVNLAAIRTVQSAGGTSLFDLAGRQIIVGVRITGNLEHPKTTLFSEPAGMSQADILSYLVLGQSSNDVGGNKAGLLMSAVSALNFGGSGGLGGLGSALSNKFGFADLGIQSGTSEDEEGNKASTTSFVLGRYLSPSLYVSYSVGIVNAVNIFRVRYRLSKRWFLQTEASSEGTGVDVLYTIDRK